MLFLALASLDLSLHQSLGISSRLRPLPPYWLDDKARHARGTIVLNVRRWYRAPLVLRSDSRRTQHAARRSCHSSVQAVALLFRVVQQLHVRVLLARRVFLQPAISLRLQALSQGAFLRRVLSPGVPLRQVLSPRLFLRQVLSRRGLLRQVLFLWFLSLALAALL